jgi:rhodanese-related sulfurtransferase
MPRELAPDALKRLWDQGQRPFVLDVREDWELAIARLPGVVHIPMSEIPDRLGELPDGQPVIVMCKAGGRSLQVAHFLERNGFAEVANLTGGILRWHADIDPTIPTY